MKKTDLTYHSSDGFWYSFIDHTPQGESVAREMASKLVTNENPFGKVWCNHLPDVLKQIRAAGYSVAYKKPNPVTSEEIEHLAAMLKRL